WVIYHVAGTLIFALILGIVDLRIANQMAPAAARIRRFVRGASMAFSVAVLAWLGLITVEAARRVTDQNVSDPTSVAVGEFARHNLPDNAVLLCEEWHSNEHLSIMFYANRVCYPQRGLALEEMTRHIISMNGIPFVVSRRRLELEPVYASGI